MFKILSHLDRPLPVLDKLKYLGVWLSDSGAAGPEMSARLAAAWRRWNMFTSIWFNKDLNLRLRRMLFVALVYNTLISALEAFTLAGVS